MASDPCAIQGDPVVSDQLAMRYMDRMKALSDDLLHGTLSLEDWHLRMQDAIRLAYLHQAVAGAPDGDERLISAADRARIERDIADQYKFLDGFAEKIVGAVKRDGASLGFITNQASMYAGSSQAEYWRQAMGVTPPHVPKDGSTQCLSNCTCRLRVECEYDSQGRVVAVLIFWELDPTKKEVHCEDCPRRAAEWNPLRIPINRARAA